MSYPYYSKFKKSAAFKGFNDHIEDCLYNCEINGEVMEFGVYRGKSINCIAKKIFPQIAHGFDSFEGLPERWVRSAGKIKVREIEARRTGKKWKRNVVDMDYFKLTQLPHVESNVILHVGWFKDTIPDFLNKFTSNAKFINVDCDIYSSCKDVLYLLNSRIVPGTVVRFDEMFDWGTGRVRYDNWPDHEYKAMMEWINHFNRKVDVLNRDSKYGSAIVVIK